MRPTDATGPRRILRPDADVPLHDAAATRVAEAAATAAGEPHGLMERAGRSVARLALAVAPHARSVAVWCGPGNNGGDGLVAARHLHRAGRLVVVRLLGDRSRLPPDAARALATALAAGVAVIDAGVDGAGSARRPAAGDHPSAGHPCLVIDALLGIGVRRPPDGAIAAAIAAINRSGAPVLAVDMPSGLHPDTGALLGDDAVRADATLALLTVKPGCWTGHGRDQTGDVWFDDLGVAAPAATAWLAGTPATSSRRHAAHKGRYGDVAVVGGAAGMVGAARLAARAALAAGAGRVWCSLIDPATSAQDPARPELMSRERWWRSPPDVLARTTVVCGCGAGDAVRGALPPLLSAAGRLVLDADALNAIAADDALRTLLVARSAGGRPTLLTPHPLEAARLLGCDASAVQHDRLAAAARLAASTGATVLLKGSGTVVAAPGAPPRINPTGNAALATAGTGDVLAGWCGGLWAQDPEASALAIGATAAWLHGHAADRHVAAGRGRSLRAADLVEALAQAGGA